MTKPILEIDGARFDTLEGFYEEVSERLIPGANWGHNLDAFNDILRGGFGTPEDGFVLRWVNSDRSREALGYPETIRWLEVKRQRCHPTNVPFVERELEAARRGEGQTVFDILLEIIEIHCHGGEEEESGLELELV
jgi:RNAse (barnase) inhibitor barstar